MRGAVLMRDHPFIIAIIKVWAMLDPMNG